MSDIGGNTWNETDASNNTPAPQGWPEGMAPSGVNDSGRSMMGATKRFWDRINGSQTAASSDGLAYTLGYGVNDSSLYQGAVYTFRSGAQNVGAVTLDVGDGSGPHPVVKNSDTITLPLAASELISGGYYQVAWDSLSAHFVLMGGLSAAIGGSLSDALTVAFTAADRSVSACITGDLRSMSIVLKADLTSVSAVINNAFVAADRSVSACVTGDLRSMSTVLKADLASVSAVVTTAFTAADRSVSACITADLRSMSLVLKADLGSVSAAIATAYTADNRSMSLVLKADLASVSAVIWAGVASISRCLTSEIASLSVHVETVLTSNTSGSHLRLAQAWGVFGGATPSAITGFNVASATASGGAKGVYRVWFSKAIDLTRNICVVPFATDARATIKDFGVAGNSTASIAIYTYELLSSVSRTNAGYVSFTVFANGYA